MLAAQRRVEWVHGFSDGDGVVAVGREVSHDVEDLGHGEGEVPVEPSKLLVAHGHLDNTMWEVLRDDGENNKVLLVLHNAVDVAREADWASGGEGVEEADVGVEVDLVVIPTTVVDERRVALHGEDVVGGELGGDNQGHV